MTAEMRNAVLNTSAQIAGPHAPAFYSSAASMLNVKPEDIEGLRRGEFIIRLSDVKPFKFHIHTHLLGSKSSMSEREWERVKQEQLKRYYRPITASTVPERPSIAPSAETLDAKALRSEPPATQASRKARPAPKKSVPHDPFNVDVV
jgi:hypothetical protein